MARRSPETHFRNQFRNYLSERGAAKAAKRISRAPASAFRPLTAAEKARLGISPKTRRYVEAGKRVTKKSPTISERQFREKQTGSTLEAYTRERKTLSEVLTKKELNEFMKIRREVREQGSVPQSKLQKWKEYMGKISKLGSGVAKRTVGSPIVLK